MKIQVDVWNYCDPITRKGRHVLKKRRLSRYFTMIVEFVLSSSKNHILVQFQKIISILFFARPSSPSVSYIVTYSWLVLVRNLLTDQIYFISFMVRKNYKTRKNVYILGTSMYSSPPQLRYPQLNYFHSNAILNWVPKNSS